MLDRARLLPLGHGAGFSPRAALSAASAPATVTATLVPFSEGETGIRCERDPSRPRPELPPQL
jgi:hypothetical protein